jgi:hypothetical protein
MTTFLEKPWYRIVWKKKSDPTVYGSGEPFPADKREMLELVAKQANIDWPKFHHEVWPLPPDWAEAQVLNRPRPSRSYGAPARRRRRRVQA